jgi:hypothetical protein
MRTDRLGGHALLVTKQLRFRWDHQATVPPRPSSRVVRGQSRAKEGSPGVVLQEAWPH